MGYRVLAVGVVIGCGRIDFEPGSTDPDGAGTGARGVEVTPPVTLSDPGTTGGCPAIAWSGSGWGAVWRDGADTSTYFARFDAAGVKQGNRVRVNNAQNRGTCPSLAWTGSEYVVALAYQVFVDFWIEIYRLDASGAPLGSVMGANPSGDNALNPSFAWNGDGFHLAWTRRLASPNPDMIRFAQLDPTGMPVGTDFPLSTAPAFYSTMIAAPPGSVAVWNEDTVVRFAMLDAGAASYKMPITASGSISGPVAAAWTGSALGLAWLTDPFHLYFALADPATGATTDPDETTATIGQVRPLVASYPSGFGQVLTYPSAAPSLVFALRDASGAKVGVAVPLAATGREPSLAFGDDRFAVAYVAGGQIQLVFVRP